MSRSNFATSLPGSAEACGFSFILAATDAIVPMLRPEAAVQLRNPSLVLMPSCDIGWWWWWWLVTVLMGRQDGRFAPVFLGEERHGSGAELRIAESVSPLQCALKWVITWLEHGASRSVVAR